MSEAEYAARAAIRRAQAASTPIPHWCGLTGFGALGDECPACLHAHESRATPAPIP